MIETRRVLVMLASFCGVMALPVVCQAQGYPDRAIRFIVPFAPGGSTDFLARMLGQKFTEAWKQQIIVDNRGGGGGTIGAALASSSPPDGYTIVLTAISHATAAGIYKKLPYDLTKDLQAVSLIATQPNVLAVHPSLPVKTTKEFIALAKSKPGELAYSTTGNGSAQHLMGELFKAQGKVDIIHVPYKGTAPALTALIAGHVSSSIQPLINAAPNAKSGRIRLLALTGAERSPVVPEVPTMMESGLPQFNVVAWYGVHAPSGTPKSAIDKINAEMTRTLNLVEIKEQLNRGGLDPSPNSPDQFAKFVEAEVVRWKKVIADAGIKGD